MLSVVMLNAVTFVIIMLSVHLVSVVMLSVVMLNAITFVIILSVDLVCLVK